MDVSRRVEPDPIDRRRTEVGQHLCRVDILVNNAAVFPPSMFLEMSEETFDHTADTDLKGAYFLAQFAAKAMISAGRGGRIINLLSTDAFRPTGTLSAYGAAKLGLWSATQAMAKELAEHRILVNALTPGDRSSPPSGSRCCRTARWPKSRCLRRGQTREKLEAAVKSGGFAQMLTTMMPLGRPRAILTRSLRRYSSWHPTWPAISAAPI